MKSNIQDSKCYSELLSRINKLNPDSKRLFGKMSVNEMICHLSDQLRLAISQKEVVTKPNLYHKTVLKWVTLYVIERMPKNLDTIKEQEQGYGKLGTLVIDFESDKQTLVCLLNKVQKQKQNLGIHPLFGRLTANEWGRLIYMHIDYHLKQFSIN